MSIDTNGILSIAAWILSGVAAYHHTHSVFDAITVSLIVFALTPWNPRAR